jgi:eukaryotic-like serine/threonine-protein kinase
MAETVDLSSNYVKPGDLIAGKYRVVRVIGEGGMGIVAEAVHQALDQRVAIKFHRPRTLACSESIARFLREAKSAAQIKSEHVVRVMDVGVLEDGDPYFVMEYLEGSDLDSLIQADGPLSIPVALDYTLQVCEALAEAHALGIVHRDLKPANLFLASRADGGVVIKLLDFGISKTLPKGEDAELSMTKTRALMGSPLYMAPEQMRSTRRVDHRADIWSLGVLVHEILTGDTPFLGETLPEVCASIAADEPVPLTMRRPEASPELEAVILRCLEKDPEDRFSDVAEFAIALAPLAPPEAAASIGRIVRILHGQVPATPPPGTSMRPSRPLRPSTPFGAILPGTSGQAAVRFDAEPVRRSGLPPKLRIRGAASDPARQGAETMATTSPSSGRTHASSGDWGKLMAFGMAMAVSAVAALLLTRSNESTATVPSVTIGSRTEPRSAAPPYDEVSSLVAAPTPRVSSLTVPPTPDVVDPGATPHAATGGRAPPPASAPRLMAQVRAAQAFTKTEHADAGVSQPPPISSGAPVVTTAPPNSASPAPIATVPPSSSSSSLGPTPPPSLPAPSGTAAFGAVRD